MNKYFALCIKFLIFLFIIGLIKINAFAGAGFISFSDSGSIDALGYKIPTSSSGDTLICPNNQYPRVWDSVNGDPFIATNRFMFASGGKWDYYDGNGTVHYLSNTANPNVNFTYTVTVNASDYGAEKFTGYTLVPGSAFGAKPGKQTANISSGKLVFRGDLGIVQPRDVERNDLGGSPIAAHDLSGWSYLLEGISGDTNYWANNWDFWRSGWNADPDVVTVTFSSNDTVATITRHNYFGSTGYVNWPLFNNFHTDDQSDTNHQEWLGRFRTPPYNTLFGSSTYDTGVEHRYYGIGEKVYLFGGGTPPPLVSSTNTVNFYLAIEDPNNVPANNWTRTSITEAEARSSRTLNVPLSDNTYKSGYGIPLVAEIRGFNYTPHMTEQGRISYYKNFRVQSDSSVSVGSTSLDTTTLLANNMKNFEFITSKISGDDEYVRYFLKQNPNSPLNSRNLYPSVKQQDGSYTLPVNSHIHATWDEYEYKWWYNTGYPDYRDVYHWVSTPQNEWYDNSKSVTIKIKGSMFDDDSRTIGE